MALTFWQKMQVAFRGWSRRREEDAKRRQEEFLQRNASWSKAANARGVCPVEPERPKASMDMEGLQAAFLDSSGAIAYYLDIDTGEVVERPAAEARLPEPRYRRAPVRTAESDAADRAAFAGTVEDARLRELLAAAGDAGQFRRAIATDRAAERAWYSFKNDRATSAVETWLRDLGLR